VNHRVHKALDLYDFDAITNYIRDTSSDVVLPRTLGEIVERALVLRLRGFGLSLGNH
jgi:hypothetical protein